jgi:hypothetical protein
MTHTCDETRQCNELLQGNRIPTSAGAAFVARIETLTLHAYSGREAANTRGSTLDILVDKARQIVNFGGQYPYRRAYLYRLVGWGTLIAAPVNLELYIATCSYL